MATNTIFERPDGYAVIERDADVVLCVPVSAADTFSAYLKPYSSESRDVSRAYWSVAKTSSEGIAAISHIVQMDVKSGFRLGAPATPLPTSSYQSKSIMLDPYGRFELVDYTEKSFALFTSEEFGKMYSETFKTNNGTYNPNLKQYASKIGSKGWAFGKRNKAVNAMLSQLTGIDIVAYLARNVSVVTASPVPESQGRSIPQIATELLTALSATTGINEYKFPSSDNIIRVILWGSEPEVTRRYEMLVQEHRDHDIRPELSATIGQSQITIAIWNDE